MFVLGFIIGGSIFLAFGVFLGAEIIDDRNRQIKYLRKQLSKQADNERNDYRA